MKKVKITVLKTTLDEQLAREYGAEGLTACPMLKEGQVFYADYAKPEGLESDLPICFCVVTWCWKRSILLWRLDQKTGSCHLQLQ